MFEKLFTQWLAAVAGAALLAWVAQGATIEYLTVGDVRNDPDTEAMEDGTTGYGAVDYRYMIGK